MASKVEIVSSEMVKPSFPTSESLRIYSLSLKDQMGACDPYWSLIVFYENAPASFSIRLRESLQRVLNHDCMYLLAGRIKDMYSIECSDQGILYIQARVDEEFSNVVRNPKNDVYSHLFPRSPQEVWKNPCDRVLLAIQVSEFVNGGMAISMTCSHAILDGAALAGFLKTWAGKAQAASQGGKQYNAGDGFVVDCTAIFPPRDIIYVVKNSPRMEGGIICKNTKGNIFTFNASNITSIQEKAGGERKATRFEAISAFLWAAVTAARKKSGQLLRMHTNCSAINLRTRIVPNLPLHSLGNLSHVAIAVCCATEEAPDTANLSVLVEKIRDSISKVTHEEMVKQHAGEECVKAVLKQLGRTSIADFGTTGLLVTSSLCRFPFYEADFGWGKPSWVGVDVVTNNIVNFLDSSNGDGIEVWLRLREEEMAQLEQDVDFLSYVSSIHSF